MKKNRGGEEFSSSGAFAREGCGGDDFSASEFSQISASEFPQNGFPAGAEGNAGEKEVQTQFTKCPSCGANMVFDPKTQGLKCPYCATVQILEGEAKTAEIALSDALLASQNWVEETTVFECTNCSARVVLESGETAKNCPFCGTTNVVPSKELSGVKPNGVLPFTLALEEANQKAKRWAKKKLFAPRKFKKNLAPQNLAGVYTPCFTFDSATKSSYRGRLGERYTVTVRDSKGRSHTETRIRWFYVNGQIDLAFDDILVNAGGRLDQKTLEKLRPYDTNNGKAYRHEYLSGFMASHYERPVTEMWEEAKGQIDERIRSAIVSRYHADEVDYLEVYTEHNDVTYKYVLLPVYVGNFTYSKKTYNFFVNGISGKVAGKTPISPLRVLFAVLMGIFALALVVVLLQNS